MATEVSNSDVRTFHLEETFTPEHVFRLRDALSRLIEDRTGTTEYSATRAVETLLADDIVKLSTLNRIMHANAEPVLCAEGSCDGPKDHIHGPACGPLCTCGYGK